LDYILIARIEQLYGKNGSVIFRSFLDSVDRYSTLKKVYIDFWGDKKTFYIEDVKDVKGKTVIKFERFNSQRDSHVLIGREVFIDKNDEKIFPTGFILTSDLIGSRVFIEGKEVGMITELMKTNANDVLVIESVDQKEILIPFVLNFIEKFNADEKKLILNITKDFFGSDED
jgi:16S rRNA processing protein RimM